jgi:hypothetical protein
MKKIFIFILFSICLFAGVVLARNIIISKALTISVKKITGLELNIEKLDLNLKDTLIQVKGLNLYNPENFSERLMTNIPEILIDCNLPALLKREVDLNKLVINLEKFVVVKNREGKLNLDSFKVVKQDKEKELKQEQKKTEAEPEKKSQPMKIQITAFDLKIGTVIYKDYSKGGEPEVNVYKLNIEEHYKNVTDIQQLVRLIIMNAITKTAISQLTGFDLDGIKKEIPMVLKGAADVVKESAVKITKIGEDLSKQLMTEGAGGVEQLSKTAEETVKAVKDDAKKALESILFGFGNKKKED